MKRGYTLVETLVCISIISILLFVGVNSVANSKKFFNDIKINNSKFLVSNLISYGKHYCYANEKAGRIDIDSKNNKIIFVDPLESSSKQKKKIVTLPKGFNFIADYSIAISPKGTVSADTIYIKDVDGEYHKITISVGVDIVNVY